MKKIVVLFAAVLTLGISVNSYAAAYGQQWLTNNSGTVVIPVSGTNPVLNLKPSANVFLGWGNDASGTAYVLFSTHATGSYAYGTSSGDTNIFRVGTINTVAGAAGTAQTITATGVTLPAVPAVNTAADWTGWTAAK